jgi:arylsulfatase A-like enzyme
MASARPNILFILIDDLGWRDLSCYGSDFYETPNIDRLAGEGLRFTDAYASCPVCSPTRASLLTGRYPARVGVTQFIGAHNVGRLGDVPYFHGLPLHEVSLAAVLREAGYQTWHVGKWHLGEQRTWPEAHGFEVNRGGCGWGTPHGGYFSPYRMPTLDDGPEGEYLTDRLTDEAIALMRNRDPDRPFFLNLWHYAVHIPLEAPEPLVEKYRQKAKDLGLDAQPAIEEGERFPAMHLRHRRIQRRVIQSDPVYAAMIENLDANIGRLLDALEAEGLAEETLVVFTSDNGGESNFPPSPTCNAPLAEGKGWMYEGGTRVCQFVRWPGVTTPGAISDEPTTSTDWYPTLLDAAGLPPRPDQHRDGVSILPLLRGEPMERGPIFWHYPHYSNQGETPACSVRDGDWKLIEHFEDGRLELFNLRDDLGEQHNRAEDDPERTRALHLRLIHWREQIEALIPKPNLNWTPPAELPEGVDPAEV